MPTSLSWRALSVTALTACLLALVVAPAQATPTWAERPTPYHDADAYDPECEGTELLVTYEVRGVSGIKNVRGGDGQAFLAQDDFRFEETWSVAATGEVLLHVQGAYSFRETGATLVPLAEVPAELVPPQGLVGPVYEFTWREAGGDVVRDADGRVLYRTAGSIEGTSLQDTLGDHAPGSFGLRDEIVQVRGPHPLLDVDLCDVALAQLG